jgi:hypothetical protein
MEQVAALRQSEALQREYLARLAALRPATREEKLAFWKQAGRLAWHANAPSLAGFFR